MNQYYLCYIPYIQICIQEDDRILYLLHLVGHRVHDDIHDSLLLPQSSQHQEFPRVAG